VTQPRPPRYVTRNCFENVQPGPVDGKELPSTVNQDRLGSQQRIALKETTKTV